jgi:hypothetical protein
MPDSDHRTEKSDNAGACPIFALRATETSTCYFRRGDFFDSRRGALGCTGLTSFVEVAGPL